MVEPEQVPAFFRFMRGDEHQHPGDQSCCFNLPVILPVICDKRVCHHHRVIDKIRPIRVQPVKGVEAGRALSGQSPGVEQVNILAHLAPPPGSDCRVLTFGIDADD